MEWWIVAIIATLCFLVGYFVRGINQKKDDGVVILNKDRCEVIFRDTYEILSKKKYVTLKMQS